MEVALTFSVDDFDVDDRDDDDDGDESLVRSPCKCIH